MPKSQTREQKMARAMQKETGQPYTACLRIVREQLAQEAAEKPTEPGPRWIACG